MEKLISHWLPEQQFPNCKEVEILESLPRTFDVVIGELRFSCQFAALGGADCLHVSLRSWVHRPQIPPPQFARSNQTTQLRGHVLCISDPSLFLHPTMNTSCFLGQNDQDPVDGVVEVAQAVARSLGVERSRIVYWGLSASSFGAAMAAISCGGNAVLVNSLLEPTRFSVSGGGGAVIAEVFGGGTLEEVQAQFPLRISASAALKAARQKHSTGPKLLIVQNVLDAHYYADQYLPFCRSLGLCPEGGFDSASTIKTMIYSDPKGHGIEPAEVLKEIISGGFPIEFRE